MSEIKQKVIFLTSTYKRPQITKKIIAIWEKIQENTKDYFEYKNIVVDSESSNLEVFQKNQKFEYHNYQNFPISNKWNYAASILKTKVFDYVIFFGSDDFIDEDFMINYHEKMKLKFDFIGVQDMYVYDLKNNKKYYWSGYKKNTGRQGETIGLGRCFSKKLIEKLNYEPWINGINKGLDGSMQKKLKNISDFTQVTINLKRDGGFACDVKSNLNITKITNYNDLEKTEHEKFNLFENTIFVKEISSLNEDTSQTNDKIVETKEIDLTIPPKKIVEFTNKKIDYEKINSIFNKSGGHKMINRHQTNTVQNNIKKNTDSIQKMLPQNKRRLI